MVFFFARWLKLKFHVTSFSWSLTCSRHSTWTFCLLFFWSFVLNLNTIKIKREFFELKIGLILLINFSFIEVSSKSLMSWFFCFLIFGILGRGVWSIKPCPSRCICERGTVDCSGLGLTEVPPNIPRTTQSLWVYKKSRLELKLIFYFNHVQNCESSFFSFEFCFPSRCWIKFSAFLLCKSRFLN